MKKVCLDIVEQICIKAENEKNDTIELRPIEAAREYFNDINSPTAEKLKKKTAHSLGLYLTNMAGAIKNHTDGRAIYTIRTTILRQNINNQKQAQVK